MPIINQVVKGGGTTPTGSISITSNGTYDVTDKATAVVNVPTTAPAYYIEKAVDANGKLVSSHNFINLNGVTDVGSFALAYAYNGASFPANTGLNLPFTTISGGSACTYMFGTSTGLTSVDLSALTTISGGSACVNMFADCYGLTSADLSALTTISADSACSSMFWNCYGLTSANLSALTTISVSGSSSCTYMFWGCNRLTSMDLSALTTISGDYACQYMFSSCTGLTSFDLSALTTISGSGACGGMFQYCNRLTSMDLSALTTISGDYACQSMFQGCTSLATVYIGGTTAITLGQEPFDNMFGDCTQNIDVYAPAANQTAIEAMSGYPNFGGTGNVVWHWRS